MQVSELITCPFAWGCGGCAPPGGVTMYFLCKCRTCILTAKLQYMQVQGVGRHDDTTCPITNVRLQV